MSELLIHRDEWVVVCDGAKALVLHNTGDAKFPNLKTVAVYEQKDLATSELGADRPGRAFSPAGHGRSSVEQTDWLTLLPAHGRGLCSRARAFRVERV